MLTQARSLNRHLGLALVIALAFHGGLLFWTFKRTYDAYVHIFFADHYARAWFDHWEPRWYTGFPMTGYPPGSHQTMALLSKALGLQNAFITVQLFSVLLFIIGVYRFSKIWVDRRSAGYAALAAVFTSSLVEVVHVFGQLPTSFSMGFLLNALPSVYQWARYGNRWNLAVAWAVGAATTAGHHVTTLFGAVFFVGPVLVLALLEAVRTGYVEDAEMGWRERLRLQEWEEAKATFWRCVVYGIGLIVLLILVVLPYWLWSRSDPITQVSIPHASRDSFIENKPAGFVFWVVPYGVSMAAIPYVLVRGYTRKTWLLMLSWTLLFVLGTGGTTPIPRFLLRGAFDILTLDRFTIWATWMMLPLVGSFMGSLIDGRLREWITAQFNKPTLVMVQVGLVVSAVVFAVFVANLTQFRRFQPEPIAVDPIVAFIEKDEHWRWRYLTLGFGDQMAWLSANTRGATVDGNYHSARRLPELTSTPVERLEGAKFRGIPGIGSLQQILAVPEKYHLKYVFSNDEFYDPLLYFSGWHRLGRLENGIMVWEREDIPPMPEVLPRREIPIYQRIMWGSLPMMALCLGGIALIYRFSKELLEREEEVRIERDPVPTWTLKPLFRWVPLAVMVGLGAGGLGLGLLVAVGEESSEEVLEAYYDDLDFRRFGEAYERLDPLTRPSFPQYTIERSVQNGLLSSYAKLENIRVEIVRGGDSFVEAEAHTDWVTSLTRYQTVQTHTLFERDGVWVIEPDQADATIPPEQFVRREGVEWLSQGRRRVSTETTGFADVQDRPELEVLNARLVLVDGRYSVVGELINTDVDPADVTVTALLFDEMGKKVSQYNAQTAIVHKILPKEVTPFRIDYEGVAGAAIRDSVIVEEEAGEFDPEAFTELDLTDAVARFDLYAKAVITPRDLYRGVGVQNLRFLNTNTGYVLEGEVINHGTAEATIPHLLVTYYDEDGKVAWVDDFYLEVGVRPQRATRFEVALTGAEEVVEAEVEGNWFTNILVNEELVDVVDEGLFAEKVIAPEGLGWSEVRVMVHAFTPEGE